MNSAINPVLGPIESFHLFFYFSFFFCPFAIKNYLYCLPPHLDGCVSSFLLLMDEADGPMLIKMQKTCPTLQKLYQFDCEHTGNTRRLCKSPMTFYCYVSHYTWIGVASWSRSTDFAYQSHTYRFFKQKELLRES